MNNDKGINIIIALLIPFPLILSGVISACGKIQPLILLIVMVCCGIVWLLGQLWGILLKRAEKKKIYAVKIGCILFGLVLLAAAELLLYAFGVGNWAFMLVPLGAGFWYMYGYLVGQGKEPVSYAQLGIFCVIALVAYISCDFFEENTQWGKTVVLLISAAVAVLGAIIINGEQLVRLSLRGKTDNGVLTAEAKRFNVKTTLAFSAIVLFMFFFSGWGAQLLWSVARWMIESVLYLLSLIPLFNTDGIDENLQQGEIPQIEQIAEENLLAQILAMIFIAAVLSFLIKPIIKGLISLYKRIAEKLGHKEKPSESVQYVDIYQKIDAAGIEKSDYKKAVKAFKKEKDTTRKYRLGYKAFMIFIGEKAERLTPSDTARVHLQKGKQLTQSPYLEQAVETYCRVRYNDYAAGDEDIEMMRSFLKTL